MPSRAQESDRFLDWTHKDAGHLLEHHIPTMLLLGVGGTAFVAAGSYVDEPILNGVQAVVDEDNFFLRLTNELGSPFALAAPLTIFGIATAAGDDKLQDAAFTSIQAYFYAGAITTVLKLAAGRYRPQEGAGARRFEPFSGRSSVPSGHSTIAFALITPWIYYYDHPATYGLFALGAGTMVSRIVRDRHWPTDVVSGATIGFLMARYLAKSHLDDARNERDVEPMVAMPLVAGTVGGMQLRLSMLTPVR